MWVSDITYLPLANGHWAYLCAFQDVASKHVVGWHVAATMPEEPCRTTIRQGNFDIAVRFPREALAEWQKLSSGVKALVDSLKR